MILAIAAAALCTTSCLDFRDELDELHSEIDALKTEMSRINESVDALSTIVKALQSNVYVKSLTPLQEGGQQVGYIITFSDGTQATLRNGQDGANGKDGKDGLNGKDGADGHTPVIGVKKDSDGVYYWTVDGKWLLDNGKKLPVTGKDGLNGQDGAPGTDGANGKDGVTPQLKTEGGYWYISYDQGKTWKQLDKCTGADGQDGAPGAPGQDGDSFFKSVDASNPSFVIITLIDGTAIKLPTWSSFEALQKQVSDINTNVAGLQGIIAQIQNDGYVTKYEVITESGAVVGYVLYFADGTKATIRNGKDGADGKPGAPGQPGAPGTPGVDGGDGADGHTPVIGVKAGSDGILYWTVDGEWLLSDGKKVPVTGKDGADGEDGQPGQPGTPGADGKDGVTPQVGIDDDGYWTVSVDGGKTWKQLLDAAGKPMPSCGADGQDGDSFFESVALDTDCITFTLADGQTFKVPYYNSLAVTFSPAQVVINGTEPTTVTYKIMNGGDDPVVLEMQTPEDGGYRWNMTAPVSDGAGVYTGTITVSCTDVYAAPSEAIILFSSDNSSIAKRLPISFNFIEVTSISLNHTEYEATSRSEQIQLTATVQPANASDKSIIWTSSDESVATVDANGLVTIKGYGPAIITATAQGVSEPGSVAATCEVSYPMPEGVYYAKVTSDMADWTGTYILVDEANKYVFVDVDTSGDYAKAKKIVFDNDGVISLSSNQDIAECELTISKDGNYYSVTTKLNNRIGSSSSGTLKCGDDLLNEIVFVEDKGARIYNKGKSSWIRYNEDSVFFRYYGSSSKVGDGVLYKKIENTGSN